MSSELLKVLQQIHCLFQAESTLLTSIQRKQMDKVIIKKEHHDGTNQFVTVLVTDWKAQA